MGNRMRRFYACLLLFLSNRLGMLAGQFQDFRRCAMPRRIAGGLALMMLLGADLRANPFVRLDYNLFVARGRGTVFIELFDDRPLTRDNFLLYVNGGHYDESLMHRMVRGFVLQGGGFYPEIQTEPAPLYASIDPLAEVDLDGNPATNNPTVDNEFANTPFRSNLRGTLAMAKLGGDPDSATSEFFFNLDDNGEPPPNGLDHQNGGFTVFARVVGDGMSLLDVYNDGLPIINLNPDTNDDGFREGGPFSTVPVFGTSYLNFVPLILRNADQIDYLGAGLTTDIPTGGLTFSVRDAFIDTGTVFTGFGGLIIGAGRKLGIREGTNLTRSLQNNGVLAPGLEFGSITVQSFRQDPGASLQIQISGTTVDTQYDRLVVTDGALLGGALDVSIFGSFAPVVGNTFTVLTAGFLVDTFDDINLPQLTAGLVWDITQTSTAFTLTVNTGDYNRDGVVNAADYVIWRKSQNTSVTAYSGADGNGDGTINQGDFTIWRANFGNTRGGSSGGSGSQAGHAVPEPSSAITLIVGGLLVLLRRRSTIVRSI